MAQYFWKGFAPVAAPAVVSAWPTLLNTGPGAIGITSFTPFFGGIGQTFTAADYGSFPTDGNGYHLIQGYDMTTTGALHIFGGDHWRIRGCLLRGSSTGGGGYALNIAGGSPTSNIIVEYCGITGTDNLPFGTIAAQTGGVNIGINCADAHTLEISNCQFWNFSTAINEPDDTCNIHDNFIANPRDPGSGGGADHTDGIISHGSANLTINHNWIDNRNGQTDCIILIGSIGHTNLRVTNNFLALNGVGYCLYGGGLCPVTTGVYTGNRFSNKYGQPFGSYLTDEPVSGVGGNTGITWSDNRETDAAGSTNGAIVG